MTTFARYVGPVAILVGLIWLGQGVGVVPGSFMTGSTFWATVGTITLAVGAWLTWWGWRRSS